MGEGKWEQGVWTHQPLYSRKPRPLGKRQPCICRHSLAASPTLPWDSTCPILRQLWPTSTSDQHGGALHFPSPVGEAALCPTAESQPLLFPERKRTKILAYLSGSIFVCTSYMSPPCKDLHRLKLYSCTFLTSSYCRLWSQCSDLFFFFINNIYYVCELCIYSMSVWRHICTLKCR